MPFLEGLYWEGETKPKLHKKGNSFTNLTINDHLNTLLTNDVTSRFRFQLFPHYRLHFFERFPSGLAH